VPRASGDGRRRSGSAAGPCPSPIGTSSGADKGYVVKTEHREPFQAWLVSEALLASLLGASLALFLSYPALHTSYKLPELRLVLQTTMALAAFLGALLAGVR